MKKDEKTYFDERRQAFQASGQTCREWCREHQIPVSTMTYWNQTYTRKRITAGTGFCKDANGAGTFHKRSYNRKYTLARSLIRQYPDYEIMPDCPPELARFRKKSERACLNWQAAQRYTLRAE